MEKYKKISNKTLNVERRQSQNQGLLKCIKPNTLQFYGKPEVNCLNDVIKMNHIRTNKYPFREAKIWYSLL